MGDDVTLLTVKLETLHSDVAEIKSAMNELTKAIMKLALIEERVGVAAAAQERAFTAISKIEGRVFQLEQKSPTSEAAAKWVDRGIAAVIGIFLMFIWDKIKD